MFEHQVQIRVRYAETDQMGYVYYGNYAIYFEVARVETFRHLGFTYKELEETGILMPVTEYKSKYIKPAKYDDLLNIKVFIREKPALRIKFEYEVYNTDQILLNISETTLVFFNSKSNRLCLPPTQFEKLIKQHF